MFSKLNQYKPIHDNVPTKNFINDFFSNIICNSDNNGEKKRQLGMQKPSQNLLKGVLEVQNINIMICDLQ
jgi:hypothetical protein